MRIVRISFETEASNDLMKIHRVAWIAWFLSTKGNEYFCEVDEEYILDRFNLTGLNAEVQHYSQALDLITDAMGKSVNPVTTTAKYPAEDELNDEGRESLESSARHLYGLIHARFVITSRGLSKMASRCQKLATLLTHATGR